MASRDKDEQVKQFRKSAPKPLRFGFKRTLGVLGIENDENYQLEDLINHVMARCIGFIMNHPLPFNGSIRDDLRREIRDVLESDEKTKLYPILKGKVSKMCIWLVDIFFPAITRTGEVVIVNP